jgi:hypothetical protein
MYYINKLNLVVGVRLTRPALKRAMSSIFVPVIVETHPSKLTDVFNEVKQYEFKLMPRVLDKITGSIELNLYEARLIPAFNMFSMILPREVVFDLAEDSRVVKIYSDEIKYAFSYQSVPQGGIYVLAHPLRRKKVEFTSTYWTKKLIGADVANNKGFTGYGVRVAVLDTGISIYHEQLAGRVYKNLTIYPAAYPDSNGHGTWCAACVAGRRTTDDVISRLVGREVVCEGMAPEAQLISVKVLDFVIGAGTDSAIIKGVEWALQEGAKVLSMSLGGTVKVNSPEEDPFHKVMKMVVERGVIPVAAAGNEGPEPSTIVTPGWLEEVLTVGAYDPITGEVAEYSSRGPTPDGRIKPDVIAPGGGQPDRGIHNAIANMLDKAGDGIENRYSPIQGTSMATPHVAGLVLCAAQMYRNVLDRELTVEEIKLMMMELGHEKTNDDGWGPIDWLKFEEWVETQYGVKL